MARTINIRGIYGNFGREITIHTVMYGVYIRFWPILVMTRRLERALPRMENGKPQSCNRPALAILLGLSLHA